MVYNRYESSTTRRVYQDEYPQHVLKLSTRHRAITMVLPLPGMRPPPTPSSADIDMVKTIMDSAKALGSILHNTLASSAITRQHAP